jgi:hypothetical protein
MMNSFDHEELIDLLNEFAVWYHRLSEKGLLPRTLGGINAAGQQFLLRLDDVTLNNDERHQLIHTILQEEEAVCYAYGGLVQQEDGEYLTLITATAEQYVIGSWLVLRGAGIQLVHKELWEGDNPEEVPAAWFLTQAVSVSDGDLRRYQAIWKALSEHAMRMQRPDRIRPETA